jgi:hypothetical protein
MPKTSKNFYDFLQIRDILDGPISCNVHDSVISMIFLMRVVSKMTLMIMMSVLSMKASTSFMMAVNILISVISMMSSRYARHL